MKRKERENRESLVYQGQAQGGVLHQFCGSHSRHRDGCKGPLAYRVSDAKGLVKPKPQSFS